MPKLSVFEMLTIAQEIQSLLAEMEKDGSLQKLEDAFGAAEHAFHNPKALELFTKLKQVFHKG